MEASRQFEVIGIGRVGVDLYGEQIGSGLENVQSFAKYLGGSPANTMFGSSRLGLKAAFLGRVGDEHNGRFLRQTLASAGVDVSHLKSDPDRLTALVFLSIQDKDTFPLVFYRDNCADMAIDESDIDEAFIADSRALLLSGTHLSKPNTYAACKKAALAARKAGTKVILDIDYRPVLWGLTGLGNGEQRFIASEKVSRHLEEMLALCDLIVGTEEEVMIAGGKDTPEAALNRICELSPAAIVMKQGARGCVVFDRKDDEAPGLEVAGFPIEVFNVLGAGDAFMAGLLRGYLRNEGWEKACTYANACGALVVSRHGCAPAMPTWEELTAFLSMAANGLPTERLREIPELEHLHWATARQNRSEEIAALACDHRIQIEEIAARHGCPPNYIPQFKTLVQEALFSANVPDDLRRGMLLDERFGQDGLDALAMSDTWIARPVEKPRSRPLRWDSELAPAAWLRTWPKHHIAKCLVFWTSSDNSELREEQLRYLKELEQASRTTSHEWLLELLPPTGTKVDPADILRSMEQLYDAGLRPDWWKLPSMQDSAIWDGISKLIAARDPHCHGVVLLGLEAPLAEIAEGFAFAPACVRGFAIGRTLFAAAAEGWFGGQLDDAQARTMVREQYEAAVAAWVSARAKK
ncbi:bifunctional 5-dehydro-2-deoxygluconokinase/5-dehydro-2-deoxyphosphogluconate aldolase [Burkholderia aenigmatica]|uniref:5-dehydro-2-deoxygluconokinase n=1 Tax=Burkholderia aenigmatica TaxID=2015348 RepID=A0A228IN55_9BURK|nr:5-dehydro-2-deoxygluconokinase [Burkholderia aenigmatica]OXI43823.1 5-dehydro-2-deoxygluconokinase [Burkholderia aenigmatica]